MDKGFLWYYRHAIKLTHASAGHWEAEIVLRDGRALAPVNATTKREVVDIAKRQIASALSWPRK